MRAGITIENMIVVVHSDAELRGALEELLRADGHRTLGAE